MNSREHYRIEKEDGKCLHVQVRYPSQDCQNCNVIFVHGFLGEGIENHRMFVKMADELNDIGYTCILFDQTGCGYSDGYYGSVRLDTLRGDLAEIVNWVKQTFISDIAFLGQSLGAALALNTIYESDIKFIIALNPAAHFDKWLIQRYGWDITMPNDYFCAVPKGVFVSRDFIGDLLKWNWTEELTVRDIPVLLVTSTDDGIGSYRTSEEVATKWGNRVVISAIDKADHSFTNQPELEKYAISVIIEWLLNQKV